MMTETNTRPPRFSPAFTKRFEHDAPALRPDRTALFLDFDGTLAEIVDDPSQARIEPRLLAILGQLHDRTGGALAVVSGRSIAQLDRLLHPLRLPLAGIHGLERRNARGETFAPTVDPDQLAALAAGISAHARSRPGMVAEEKPASVALHYRRRPELAAEALALAEAMAAADPAIRLLRGKMVVELSLGHRTKGDAIAAFMAEPPFHGRLPVFAGDDVTDEDGFRVLERWNGVSIKIGPGPTAAAHRVERPGEIAEWLESLSARWNT